MSRKEDKIQRNKKWDRVKNIFYWCGDNECHLFFENKTIKYR